MLICDLFDIQTKLDTKVSINESLNDYKITSRKNLELHIKLSDLANETKCYAYTNDSDLEINEDIVLKKYVSCLQHVLSIGIDNGYDKTISDVDISPSEYCLTDQFLNLYIDINDLIISKSEDHFETLFEDLLTLGTKLGFNENKINMAFREILK